MHPQRVACIHNEWVRIHNEWVRIGSEWSWSSSEWMSGEQRGEGFHGE
ncbi:hypothetical protein O1L68_19140 [Streptomyces lydicus]|nr:hypothetical protein [Streptomyces lydicus]